MQAGKAHISVLSLIIAGLVSSATHTLITTSKEDDNESLKKLSTLSGETESPFQSGTLWSQDPNVIQEAIQRGEVHSDGSINLEKGFRIIDEDLEAIMADTDKTPKIVGKYRVL